VRPRAGQRDPARRSRGGRRPAGRLATLALEHRLRDIRVTYYRGPGQVWVTSTASPSASGARR
jgi:hypothetical protein